jgi:hypothetical protein
MKSRPRGFKRRRTVLLSAPFLFASYVLKAGLQRWTNYVPPDGFVPYIRRPLGLEKRYSSQFMARTEFGVRNHFRRILMAMSVCPWNTPPSLTMRVELQKSVSRNRRVVFST